MIDPLVREAIERQLEAVATRENVRLLWAVESGSRAWGFPSPDSDYDCRFLYLRQREDYLALFPPRDVIEEPLDPVFDVNGWDLVKALRLALKGNAVILEWLTSPIRYAGSENFRNSFLVLATKLADRDRIGWHYLHLAYSMRKRVVDPEGGIRLKKLFYVLRPAMALRVLRLNPGLAFPPMQFQSLMAAAELPSPLIQELDDLIARKSATRELGSAAASPAAQSFYETEIHEAERWISEPKGLDASRIALADAFFRETLDLYTPPYGST